MRFDRWRPRDIAGAASKQQLRSSRRSADVARSD
jgi:hypothetical protein